jgi:hypothetical protein
MNNYIGTVLHFDQYSYSGTLSAYAKVFTPINEAGQAYEDLDKTFVFNEDVLKDMMAHKSSNINQQYAKVIDNQISSLKFTSKAVIASMKSQIQTDIHELEEKIEKIFTAINEAHQFASPLATLHLDISNITIVKGKATITEETKEKIKDLCEIKIRNEDQSKAYNLALKIQEDYKNFIDFIKEKNPQSIQNPYPSTLFAYNGGRFTEKDGMLQINSNVVRGL